MLATKSSIVCCFLIGLSLIAQSQESENINPVPINSESRGCVYVGLGQTGSSGDSNNDFTPWSLGFYGGSDIIGGLDISGEGTQEDSTYGYDSVEQGFSLNFLGGVNFLNSGDFKVDFLLLLGIVQTAASCPEGDSYLGYQCYADSAPSTEYDINYGAVLAVSYKNIMSGIRITGESVQVLIGLSF